jgi:hypothetical protein
MYLRIQTAILNKLAVAVGGRLVLLPGEQGFVRNNRRVFNLSYYVWPAIHDFASQPGDQGRWRRLEDDGLWLLDNTAFGTYRLPPDWAMYGGNQDIRIADGWPPYFGFDAIRIPLYLAWQNEAACLPRFLAAWQTPRFAGLDQPGRRRRRALSVQRRLPGDRGRDPVRCRRPAGQSAGGRYLGQRRLLLREPQAPVQPGGPGSPHGKALVTRERAVYLSPEFRVATY